MSRSRLTFSVDDVLKLFVARYIGDIGGDEINTNMIQQLSQLDQPWQLDSIIDMRRYDTAVMSSEIAELAAKWNDLAQGRDKGRMTAVISEDPLVHARANLTQDLFPTRVMAYFYTFDEGLDWIKTARSPVEPALAD